MTKRVPVKRRKKVSYDGKKADKAIKYCESCNRCWETDHMQKNINHYKDFPTYKKERKICMLCKKIKGAHVS